MHTVIVYEILKKEKGLYNTMKSLLRGTLFLAFVLLISKLFGFVYRLLFSRIAGEEAVGLYMTVYPTFIFFIAVVQLGLPIAITRLVAQFYTLKNSAAQAGVLRKSLQISTISLILWLPLLVIISPFITSILLHNKDAIYTLIVAICTLPIVIWSSIYRAYLQGIDKISTSAWGHLLEQVIRIVLLYTLLPFTIHQEPAIIAAATMVITACAELSSLLFNYAFYRRYRPTQNPSTIKAAALFEVALPSAGSKLFGSFTWFLEPIIFLYALTKSGLSATSATNAYGIVSNVHIPLLLFPAFIPQALAIALIPSVSSLQTTERFTAMNHQLLQTMRLCAVVGCYACTTFFIVGDILATRLFHIDEGHWILLLAPIFYFYYIQAPLHAVLQALNYAQIAMKNSIIGGCLKLVCLFFLASHPSLQINGAIVAIGIGVVVTSFMHVASVQSIPKIELPWRSFLLPFLIFVFSISSTFFIEETNHKLIVGLTVLTLCLLITSQLKLSDLQMLLRLRKRFTLNK